MVTTDTYWYTVKGSIRNYRYVPVITDTYQYTLKVPNYFMLAHNAPHPPPTISRIVIPLDRKLTSHTRWRTESWCDQQKRCMVYGDLGSIVLLADALLLHVLLSCCYLARNFDKCCRSKVLRSCALNSVRCLTP